MVVALGGRVERVDGCCMDEERAREVGLRETASEDAVVRLVAVVWVVAEERAGEGSWESRA